MVESALVEDIQLVVDNLVVVGILAEGDKEL